jgi:hypothetical protein
MWLLTKTHTHPWRCLACVRARGHTLPELSPLHLCGCLLLKSLSIWPQRVCDACKQLRPSGYPAGTWLLIKSSTTIAVDLRGSLSDVPSMVSGVAVWTCSSANPPPQTHVALYALRVRVRALFQHCPAVSLCADHTPSAQWRILERGPNTRLVAHLFLDSSLSSHLRVT